MGGYPPPLPKSWGGYIPPVPPSVWNPDGDKLWRRMKGHGDKLWRRMKGHGDKLWRRMKGHGDKLWRRMKGHGGKLWRRMKGHGDKLWRRKVLGTSCGEGWKVTGTSCEEKWKVTRKNCEEKWKVVGKSHREEWKVMGTICEEEWKIVFHSTAQSIWHPIWTFTCQGKLGNLRRRMEGHWDKLWRRKVLGTSYGEGWKVMGTSCGQEWKIVFHSTAHPIWTFTCHGDKGWKFSAESSEINLTWLRCRDDGCLDVLSSSYWLTLVVPSAACPERGFVLCLDIDRSQLSSVSIIMHITRQWRRNVGETVHPANVASQLG